MQKNYLLSTIFFLLMLIAPQTLEAASVSAAPSNWHHYYQPITEHQAEIALNEGFEYIKSILGEPTKPIEKVHLRLSEPIHPNLKIKRKFQLTEITDADHGVYTIYLSQIPSQSPLAFYGQLGHEIGHLFDARIHDAYFEGMCTLMSEKYLRSKGVDWENWLNYFQAGHEPFYGQTYFMMKKIVEVVGEKALANFHHYVLEDPRNPDKLHININGWISTLPENHQAAVKEIIYDYAPVIQSELGDDSDPVAFMLPSH